MLASISVGGVAPGTAGGGLARGVWKGDGSVTCGCVFVAGVVDGTLAVEGGEASFAGKAG